MIGDDDVMAQYDLHLPFHLVLQISNENDVCDDHALPIMGDDFQVKLLSLRFHHGLAFLNHSCRPWRVTFVHRLRYVYPYCYYRCYCDWHDLAKLSLYLVFRFHSHKFQHSYFNHFIEQSLAFFMMPPFCFDPHFLWVLYLSYLEFT